MRILLPLLSIKRKWWHLLWWSGFTMMVVVWILINPMSPPSQTPITTEVDTPKPTIDPAFLNIMETARQESIELGQRRLTRLVDALSHRVEAIFLPHYLSFSRRKLEELSAYNTFAVEQIKSLFGGKNDDTATPMLLRSFEENFVSLVLIPNHTQEILRNIGREVARQYSALVAIGFQKLQENRGIQFAQWQRYLESINPGQIQIPNRPPLNLPITTLTAPDPMRERLGAVIATTLEEQFKTFPKITADTDGLRMPDGRSIFEIGSDVWTYYGSYVLYWFTLIFLLRSGIIPANLFAFLLGWLAWETFVWGSWIAFESFNFEQTKAQLEPIILHQTDTYFSEMRAALTAPGKDGPFQVLWGIEQAWKGGLQL